jgi:hypothetical protein
MSCFDKLEVIFRQELPVCKVIKLSDKEAVSSYAAAAKGALHLNIV